MKKFKFWLILIFIILSTSFIGGEIIVRIYDKIKGVSAPYTHNLPECIAQPSGYYNYDIRPNLSVMYDSKNPRKFTFNKWGFRSANYKAIKPKNVKRIFCLGGSSTFDPYVSDEQSWTYLLGKNLSKNINHKVESINAGRFGYTTSEIVGLLHHKVVRHQPDLIVLYSTFNDVSRKLSPYYGADDGPQLYGNSTLSFLNQHSALFALLDFKLRYVIKSDFYTSLIPNSSNYKEPPIEHTKFISDEVRANNYIVKTFERNIRTIVSIAKNNNIKILLSTQIFESDLPTTKMVNRLDDVLRKVAIQENVPFLEVNTSKKQEYIKNGILESYVHLTKKGCRFLSEKISDKIIADSLIH